MKRNLMMVLPVAAAFLLFSTNAFAEGGDNTYLGYIGLSAGHAMGLAVLGGGIGQGLAARGALEGIARNPQAGGKIQTAMLLGLAFVESLVIFALIIAYMLQSKIVL